MALAEYDGFPYHALIHSDLDTFLMPGFASWTQPNASTLIVGYGGYGSKSAISHLSFVSTELGLNATRRMNGIGSTWFGESRLMAAAASLTVEIMRWLNTQVKSFHFVTYNNNSIQIYRSSVSMKSAVQERTVGLSGTILSFFSMVAI